MKRTSCRKFLLVLLIILPGARIYSQALSNIPGAFSEAGFGVRPSGMGLAFTAISDDGNAFLTNPAGMLLGQRPAFTANYTKLLSLVPSGYFGLLQPISRRYAMGGGFAFVGDDALMENMLGVSLAFTLPNIPVGRSEIYFDQMAFGVSFKNRWTAFGNNADGGDNRVTGSGQGYGIDLGYILLIDKSLSIGVMLRDLINDFLWDSSVSGKYSERIPSTLRIGGAYRYNEITVAFDLRKSLHEDTANRVYFGFERTIAQMVILRTGFSNNIGASDLNRRWSFGLTLLQKLGENYAIGINSAYRIGNIENLFRFGMDFSWGEPKRVKHRGRIY
jgi:hypothetical protein